METRIKFFRYRNKTLATYMGKMKYHIEVSVHFMLNPLTWEFRVGSTWDRKYIIFLPIGFCITHRKPWSNDPDELFTADEENI